MAHGIIRPLRHALIHGAKHGGAAVLGPVGPGTPTLWSVIGDSNGVGIGVVDAADRGFGVSATVPGIPFNSHYANGVGPPPVFIDFPALGVFGSLGPYAATSTQSMGVELSAGPELFREGATPAIFKTCISGTALSQEWFPTSTYPAAGAGNIYHLWAARVQAAQIATGRTLGGVIVSLGTNDANSTILASAFAANMAALITQIRADFGASTAIVWIKTNPNSAGTFTSTVRTQQDAAVVADPTIKLIDNDDLGLNPDNLHYPANGYLTLGQRAAFGLMDARGYARRIVTTTPSVLGYGPESHGAAGNLSVVSYGGEINGDLQILQVGTAKGGGGSGVITTPSGWTLVGASGDSSGSGVISNTSIYARQVTTALLNANGGRMPATTVAIATSPINAAQCFSVRGPAALTAANVDVVQPFVANVFNSGPTSVTGLTTLASDALVACFTSAYCGSSGTVALTNPGLTNVVEVKDTAAVIVTDRVLMACTVGTKSAIGATGAWSWTSSAGSLLAAVTISIKA